MYQQTLPDGSTRTTGWICTRCMSSLWPTVASESDPEKLKAAVTLLMSGLINVGFRPGVESAMLSWSCLDELQQTFGIAHQCSYE